MFGASSSAQPPVPPITSFCSFLFYPTSWTSRVFTSFTITCCTNFIRATKKAQFGSGIENYSTARERLVSSQAESEAELRIDELALYLEAVGAKRIGNAEEITALRARVDEQEKQLAELRAHVMRTSSQPSIGTSSSDPPPATNRDVSTAQHQPLPSPLDPDTADDTLVTSADTMTHLADTPPGATTLDRADDQPRRFNFGPF
ncbi:hypothetical protein JCGZ_15087 [Jatropha curcas]|uniref:Uncharacterized protein n=1 Tax=Jatropha curcas TaxID=180498 RepID=A0A067LA26_JATCU|nr:hypothetical protein JCGZ_15087 [Jatropha curcas]